MKNDTHYAKGRKAYRSAAEIPPRTGSGRASSRGQGAERAEEAKEAEGAKEAEEAKGLKEAEGLKDRRAEGWKGRMDKINAFVYS